MQKHSFNVFKDCPQTIPHLLTSMKRVSIASLKRELKARLSAVEQELDDLRSQNTQQPAKLLAKEMDPRMRKRVHGKQTVLKKY
jgi:hypothetical protein